jgi:hypothetical protein
LTAVWPAGCAIGDVIVTTTFGGYIVRRVLARPTNGLWWEAVAFEEHREAAILLGCDLTKPLGARLWLQEQENDAYREIACPTGIRPVAGGQAAAKTDHPHDSV